MKKVLFILCFLIHQYAAKPCTCIGMKSMTIAYQLADMVFRCRILSCDTIITSDTLGAVKLKDNYAYDIYRSERLRYKVEVLSFFKGYRKTFDHIFNVYTNVGRSMCGSTFAIDNEYIVYSNWKNKIADREPPRKTFLYTGSCSGNQLYNESDTILLKRISHRK